MLMNQLQSRWATLSPARRRFAALSGIAISVFAVLAILQQEPEREAKYSRRTDQVQSIFTDRLNRNASIDALAGQMKRLREETERALKAQEERAAQNERLLERMEAALRAQDASLEARFAKMSSKVESAVSLDRTGNAASSEKSEDLAGDPSRGQSSRSGRGQDDAGAKAAGEAHRAGIRQNRGERFRAATGEGGPAGEALVHEPGNPFELMPTHAAPSGEKPRPPVLSVFSEAPAGSEKGSGRSQERKDKRAAAAGTSEAYIPAGAILTGTIITGGDFPTNKGAFEQPTPLLIRLSKEAILPNRYRSDVRECFLLAGGAGDLASERAKLRGEALSCVRRDGSVIETRLDSYVAGEDGKEGVRGRVVSKQGQFIARSLMAGFLGGMSEAFDVNPVPVIATSSTGEQQYQDVLSGNAVRGAAVKGASDALDRLARFYLDMAEDIFPVIEINAGREVDVVVISGARLSLSAPAAPERAQKDAEAQKEAK